jgi:hypothetical protein
MAIRKHDLDVPRDASGHRIKDAQNVVKDGVNKRSTGRSFVKTNKKYTVTIVGTTGDKFKLSVNGYATADIAYNAVAATIQAALLAADPNANTHVAQVDTGIVDVTFYGKYAGSNSPTLSIDTTGLVGMDSTGTVELATAGSIVESIDSDGDEPSEVTIV